jgi:probable phosphoglycerate mutase
MAPATLSPHTIYLVRHGETEWNVARRVQGAGDSPLTRRGIGQAEAIGALLARTIVPSGGFVIVSSPQGRARRTAEIIGAALGLAVAIDARLAEVTLGGWDGMTMAEIDAEFPGALDGTTRGDWYFRAPSGEGFEAASARVAAWLRDVACSTIAVSHGLTGQLLRGVYAGLDRTTTLEQPKPQDGVFRLQAGTVEFLPAT